MYTQLKNLEYLYGDDVSVQIPNEIFKTLSLHIKDKKGRTSIQQTSFAYAYLVTVALLYKYAHFVDIDNDTYIQNADIKELLGYSRTTKTVDHIIKKEGVLDQIGLTMTTKDYPIRFTTLDEEKINNIPLREIVTINDIDDTDINYNIIKSIVKNFNYTIKEPTFLFEYNGGNGTLYEYSNTHKVTIKELLTFISNGNLDNIDMYMYFYFKSKCKGLEGDSRALKLKFISNELGIGFDAFYAHLEVLKRIGFLEVEHIGWVMGYVEVGLEGNEYHFNGI